MRVFVLLTLLLALVSCGGGGGSGSNPVNTSQPLEENECSIVIRESDELGVIVVKANEARVRCGLSEEEIVKILK